MRSRRVKRSNCIVFNRIAVLAAACVLSFIAGMTYTKAKAGMPITLFNATTVTGKQNVPQPLSDETEAKPVSMLDSGFPALDEQKEQGNTEPKSEPSEKWRKVRMKVTGYCPCSKCCGQYSDGITANGHEIQPGDTFVAADKRYSFGTEMVIEGYNDGKPVKVLDRGGAIKGNKLDAFFHTHQQALEWGVRYIDVKVRDI
jgi:3D (Asp-Asp-Asp) domain-containing protein